MFVQKLFTASLCTLPPPVRLVKGRQQSGVALSLRRFQLFLQLRVAFCSGGRVAALITGSAESLFVAMRCLPLARTRSARARGSCAGSGRNPERRRDGTCLHTYTHSHTFFPLIDYFALVSSDPSSPPLPPLPPFPPGDMMTHRWTPVWVLLLLFRPSAEQGLQGREENEVLKHTEHELSKSQQASVCVRVCVSVWCVCVWL